MLSKKLDFFGTSAVEIIFLIHLEYRNYFHVLECYLNPIFRVFDAAVIYRLAEFQVSIVLRIFN